MDLFEINPKIKQRQIKLYSDPDYYVVVCALVRHFPSHENHAEQTAHE